MTTANIHDLTEHQKDLDNMNDIDSIVSADAVLPPEAAATASSTLAPAAAGGLDAQMSRTSFEIEDFSGNAPDSANSANTFDNDRQSISSRLSRALTKESSKTGLQKEERQETAPTVASANIKSSSQISSADKRPKALQALIQRFKALFV